MDILDGKLTDNFTDGFRCVNDYSPHARISMNPPAKFVLFCAI